MRSGIKVEIISGSEEARLVSLAVRRKVRLGKREWILVDLGGGSVEISQIDAAGIVWTETRNVGAVRLLEEFRRVSHQPGLIKKILADYIAMIKIPRSLLTHSLIATGGNIEKIASLLELKTDRSGAARVPRPLLSSLIEKLSGMTLSQRIHQLNLRSDRADVILPAAMVYDHIAELCRSRTILVPFVGLKEGVVFDIVDDLFKHKEHSKKQEDQIVSAAMNLGRRFNFEAHHHSQVTKLAVSLFDQIKPLHRMIEEDRNLLLAAAMLHDIGTYISYKSHHKHSLYILSQSELPGLTSRQMLMVANIARYHRKSEPQSSHPLFMKLSPYERDTVSRLASILRIADSFDKDHLQRVRDLKVRCSGQQVRIKPCTTGRTPLNEWSFEKKSNMFGRIFKRKVRLIR